MKKALITLSKIVVVAILLLAIDVSLVLNCVQAADIQKKSVYQIDECKDLLIYKGIKREAAYVVYKENGKEYPAYCINPERIGVGDIEGYDVSLSGYINDVVLWRIITNGYPYKTIKELGVANNKEAYLATKQAIYSYLDGRDVNKYSGIGEAGERTLNALKQIWNNAMKSDETKISNVVDVKAIYSEWSQDKLNSAYISKTYKIEAPAPITNFSVEIEGNNIPQGLVIVNKNNTVQNEFAPNEEFKILIPIEKIKNDGSLKININTTMETKPVIYGASPDSKLQNYALTGFTYEDSSGTYYEKYQKNETQIKILKQEKDTKIPLEGVEFQLLDQEQKVILQSLITDGNGEIILKDIVPGTYCLKEVKTLPGYVLYDENIKIDINLNEQVNVVVNNSKENNIEVSKEVSNIEVGKTVENIKENSKETNINKEINEKNIIETTNNTNITIEKNETNIQKLPKTGM